MPSATAPLLTMINSRPCWTNEASCSHQCPIASSSRPLPSLVTRLDPTLTTMRRAVFSTLACSTAPFGFVTTSTMELFV
ncbi:hypothetical protein D9M69_670880 [compost metagenome]